jgi:hypothetical protein
MINKQRFESSTRRISALVLGLSVMAASSVVLAADSTQDRYPYDPACPWGRIANGKGMLVRCITQGEASALLAAAPAPAPSPVPAPTAETGATLQPGTNPSALMAGFAVSVGPVAADEGKLPIAEKKLGLAKDRYLECADRHGGLSAATAEVHVRFLVRARGRAEGVSVQKRAGLSAEAARCVADVVDRRYVGTPEVEMVGATVVIKFQKQPP